MKGYYLTSKGLAEYLNVSDSAIRKWVHRAMIPSRRFGRSVRFEFRQIEEWAQKQESNRLLEKEAKRYAPSLDDAYRP